MFDSSVKHYPFTPGSIPSEEVHHYESTSPLFVFRKPAMQTPATCVHCISLEKHK